MKGPRALFSLLCQSRSTLIYCRRYFLVGASWRLPHPTMAGPLDILFRIIAPALARAAGPFYFVGPPPLLHRARQCSILFCSIFILFRLFALVFIIFFYFFFRRVIFRQPLALCCAVARRRRVSARISRLPWHRFIIASSGCANRLNVVKDISEQIRRHFKYAYYVRVL